jgi:hypothetical protein
MPDSNKPHFISKSKATYKGWPRWAKIIIAGLLSLLILMVIGWFVISWYVNHHKKEILSKITAAVSESVDGNFHIDDIEPALLQGFPNIAIRLKGVTLSDSLYYQHKRNTLEFKSVYIKVNVFSILTKHPQIIKVTLADGAIYLFHNKFNYSNTYLLQSKKKKTSAKGKQLEINKFGIENVLFTYDFFDRDKQFKIGVKELNGSIDHVTDVWKINADTHVHFYQMAFNLEKGGFLKNKDLDGDLHILFNTKTKALELPKQFIRVNGTNIKAGCLFNFGLKPIDYTIDVDAPAIGFKEGASFLSDSIASRLDSFDFGKKIAIKFKLNGSFQYPDTPLIHASWEAVDNTLSTSFGLFEHVKLKGEFGNYYIPGKGRGDDNSAVVITDFNADFVEIPLRLDTFVLYGLINPQIKLKLKAKFPVEKLNALIGNTFNFTEGNADIDVNYTGPISNEDSFKHSMFGHVILSNASFSYVPRKLALHKCNVNLAFQDQDLFLNNTTLYTKRSSVRIDGVAHNFMNVYLKDPGQVAFNWNISSARIDLNDFTSFLEPRVQASGGIKNKNHKIERVSNSFNTLLDKSNMILQVNVQKLNYNHFNADHILANLTLTDNQIEFKNVSLNHAGGSVTANASANISGSATPFQIQATVNKVKIDQLFYAFDNFGQDALNPKNLEGSLTAKMDVKGSLNAAGSLVKRSMVGKVSFVMNNGELNGFAPLLKIQKFIFKKRDLGHVTFEELKDDLDIYGGKIKINPMTIVSSAVIMKLEGIYAFDKGTDISIIMPLRNPEKDKDQIAKGKTPKFNKGIVLYLRAKDDKDGNVNISWDPLKKGLKDNEDSNADPDAAVKQE